MGKWDGEGWTKALKGYTSKLQHALASSVILIFASFIGQRASQRGGEVSKPSFELKIQPKSRRV